MNSKLHVALNVKNLTESIEFYRTAFGTEPDKTARGYARFDLSSPPIVLTLNEQLRVKRGGSLNHFGIRLGSAEDYQAARERLGPTGLIRKEQRRTKCCHAIQDKIWLKDPDGNHWEFYVLLEDFQPPASEAVATPSGSVRAGDD